MAAPLAPVVARAMVQAAKQYGPAVLAKAQELLSAATEGKVQKIEDLQTYMKDERHVQLAMETMGSAGMDPQQLLPDRLFGSGKLTTLKEIRDKTVSVLQTMQSNFEAGSDKTLSESVDGRVKDKIRRLRVEAALRVFGNPRDYFLCLPKGGIPVSDFQWYFDIILNRQMPVLDPEVLATLG